MVIFICHIYLDFGYIHLVPSSESKTRDSSAGAEGRGGIIVEIAPEGIWCNRLGVVSNK